MLLAQVLTLLVYVAALVALSSPILYDSTFDLQVQALTHASDSWITFPC